MAFIETIESWKTWTTHCEMEFATYLARHRPTAFARYAQIVLGDYRRWDKEVDVEYLKRGIRNLLRQRERQQARLSAAENNPGHNQPATGPHAHTATTSLGASAIPKRTGELPPAAEPSQPC